MEKADIVIIGAGVVGLSVGAYLAQKYKSVYVLERHAGFGQEISSRNSEVIHAGIYYPKESLKAKLCVRGNRMLYDLCVKYYIPHKQIGKLIVATNKEEEQELAGIFKKGRDNGACGLRLLTKQEIKDFEPNITAMAALYSPTTGIIDSHALMQHFADIIKDNNGAVVYSSEVIAIVKASDGYELTINDAGRDMFKFKARIVVNSAGLEADHIAEIAGFDIKKQDYCLKYCKGQYFRVNNSRKCSLISRLIYPVPHEQAVGLGVHATKDLADGLRLGPDAHYIARDRVNYEVDMSCRKNFLNSASKFLPFLTEEDLSADTSGIRPKLQGENDDFRDFVIKEESDLGFSGFINLIGVESPGLTSALSIAEYVETLIKPL